MKKLLSLLFLTPALFSSPLKANNLTSASSFSNNPKIINNDITKKEVDVSSYQAPKTNLILEDSIECAYADRYLLKDSYIFKKWNNDTPLTLVIYFRQDITKTLQHFRLVFTLEDMENSQNTRVFDSKKYATSETNLSIVDNINNRCDYVKIGYNSECISINIYPKNIKGKFKLKNDFYLRLIKNTNICYRYDKAMLLIDEPNGQGKNSSFNLQYISPIYSRYGGIHHYEDFDKYYLTCSCDDPITLEEIKKNIIAYDYGKNEYRDYTVIYDDYFKALEAHQVNEYRCGLYAYDDDINDANTMLELRINIVDNTKPDIKIDSSHKADENTVNLTLKDIQGFNTNIDVTKYLHIEDNYDLNPHFSNAPSISFTNYGEKEVLVSAIDQSGNQTTKKFKFVLLDQEAPKIEGEDNISHPRGYYMYADELISEYKITDNVKVEDVYIENDTFSGNGAKEGTYQFTIVAVDSQGNKGYKKVTYEVYDSDGPVFFINEVKFTLEYDAGFKSANELLKMLKDQNVIKKNLTDGEYLNDEYKDNYSRPGNYKVILRCLNEEGEKEYVTVNLTISSKKDTISPQPNLLERIGIFFSNIWEVIKNFFVSLWNKIISIFHN
jgi:hypothetical protein